VNGAHTRGRFQKAPALPASSRVIEPFLGFLFTQTGFRCAEPLKKSFKTDRRQFVNLLGSARALGRLFVVHTNRKSLRRPKYLRVFSIRLCNAQRREFAA